MRFYQSFDVIGNNGVFFQMLPTRDQQSPDALGATHKAEIDKDWQRGGLGTVHLGHKAHIRNRCFSRPAMSPAAAPLPTK